MHGQIMPVNACNAHSEAPSAVARAAILARNTVRARRGSGPKTRTSRRSGNVESQLSTARMPVTSMVVAIRKCSSGHARTSCSVCGTRGSA